MDSQLTAKLQELLANNSELSYRQVHEKLQSEEAFKEVGFKKVQKLMRDLKGDGHEGYSNDNEKFDKVEVPSPLPQGPQEVEICISRPDISQKFGMMIDIEPNFGGGHRISEIREGGLVEAWNREHPDNAIQVNDILISVNGKITFDEMMEQFKSELSCQLRRKAMEGLKVDDSEAKKEASEWERRRARVTAALVPGLKKIIDSEFGAGAGDRLGRIEKMYHRVGSNDIFKEELPSGSRLAPGYVENLTPVAPFHDVKDHPWCAELQKHWKGIRQELKRNLDESLWTAGAYQKSNEAYGKDWKIMGVLTEDSWQDEKRFKVTTGALKELKGIKPFEAFFAKMPPRTKIAPHSDNLNYVLTSHLALELEEGKCSITVGNEEKYWKEGEMLILDTTFIHSTKNESNRPRYILVLRFWHPGLTEEERRAIHVSHAILARAAKGM